MASITLTIPDAQVTRVIDALCAGQMQDAVTPVPPTAALAKQVVIDWIKARVLAYEEDQARKALAAIDVSDIVT